MVKKVKKFNYKKNLKKAWKKLKEKENPQVKTDELKEFWNKNASMKDNYSNLGLSMDPNKTLEIPRAKVLLNPEVMEIEEVSYYLSNYINAHLCLFKPVFNHFLIRQNV